MRRADITLTCAMRAGAVPWACSSYLGMRQRGVVRPPEISLWVDVCGGGGGEDWGT